MFRELFCKHTYKYYNTKVVYPHFSVYGYNSFQFVCTKCGKEVEVSELDIDNAYSNYKSSYKKGIVFGKDPIKSSKLSIRRHNNIGIRYESPAVTLILEDYAKQGINLMELDY